MNNYNKKSLLLLIFFVYSHPLCSLAQEQLETFETVFNKATQECRNNNYTLALELYEKSFELNNQCSQAYFNAGLLHIQQKNFTKAIDLLQKAIQIDPSYAKAYLQLGTALKAINNSDSALMHFKRAIDLNPSYTEALIEYARALNENSKFEESITYFKKALALQPNDVNTMLELANTLNMSNQTEQALDYYYHMLNIIPNNSSVLYNIAYTLKKLNKIEDALPYYKKVLEIEPTHAEAHFSLGLAYLGKGDFEHGWQEYEWRWKREHNDERNLGKPLWDGLPLEGKTILIHAEQGLGDAFQFVRYAKMLKELQARVVVAVHPPLVQLFGLCPYIDQVVSLFEKLPYFDVQAPMLTLPYCFKTRLENVPNEIPYLYAKPDLIASWKEKLSTDNNFKVGICWQGNSNYSTHFLRTAVAAKSVAIAKFLPILTMPNVTVYNLQKITGQDQLKDFSQDTNMICFDGDFDEKHGRFMDTAAIMKNLDLMITVDTSIAHLAGGLGIPVWCLIPEPADWRWMLDRNDTPWYPNMRLFRQTNSGDWDSVIDKIAHELSVLVNTKKISLKQQLIDLNTQIYSLAQHLTLQEKKNVIQGPDSTLITNLFESVKKRSKLQKEIADKGFLK